MPSNVVASVDSRWAATIRTADAAKIPCRSDDSCRWFSGRTDRCSNGPSNSLDARCSLRTRRKNESRTVCCVRTTRCSSRTCARKDDYPRRSTKSIASAPCSPSAPPDLRRSVEVPHDSQPLPIRQKSIVPSLNYSSWKDKQTRVYRFRFRLDGFHLISLLGHFHLDRFPTNLIM